MSADERKILIVDDEYAFCKSLKQYLDKLGYQAMVATNGEHALDLIREEAPELMTLDIRMPGINGYEVLNKVRHLAPEMRVVVVTAVDVPRMEEMLEHSGAHAVVHKPINLEELRRVIDKLLPAPQG
ncbi:response regulator [Desulfurivibrio dismutans]|uniref:response regulator n=1 Tax=Desulfurivibrio dismutans TaxID=1398908 RepID=UPI0023DC4C5B|nr:response regulator [Desulfurivibrio alkaliphilus]MDF1615464.1 response regulator [Desulfurivibrio alkaliphilus]